MDFATLAFWIALAVGPGDQQWIAGHPVLSRVRPGSPDLRHLIDLGSAGSPTFARLIERLEASDAIVFVRFNRCSGEVPACLHLLSQGSRQRTIRITLVRLGRSERELTVLLAHELEHAAEISDSPAVIDTASLRESYARAGRRNAAGFETERARTTARRVQQELGDPLVAQTLRTDVIR